jgi:anthranilate synthase
MPETTIGAPQHAVHHHYTSAGGVRIACTQFSVNPGEALSRLQVRLDSERGVLLSSRYEYPGRYTRWDIGFVNPPLVITARGRQLRLEALNARGRVLLPELQRALAGHPDLTQLHREDDALCVQVREASAACAEEQRSRQPSTFCILRAVSAHFASPEDAHLGLYGAFGYDLCFQFEAVQQHLPRRAETRDLVLYLPDELLVHDHMTGTATLRRYEFHCRPLAAAGASAAGLQTTGGLRRTGAKTPFVPAATAQSQAREPACDHAPGEYAEVVREAVRHFQRGDLFEVVPGQVFQEPCRDSPAQIFARLQRDNPAPYGTLMNLGEGEYLLAASPEMYVRVTGRRIETCPISGTIARGRDALEDAQQIRTLLNSEKDEAELSMCTDVDRNDKSRVCVPGSVRILGRRQVELYSRLIHTVDHVEGTLAEPFDALDGFLSHAWAVTVTGAPKQAAIQFLEAHEKSPRHWYGGAIGLLGFNGDMNTGLTLRAARIVDGVAQVRVGATLLLDSDPQAEEAETRLKASAVLAAIRGERPLRASPSVVPERSGLDADEPALRVLMVDHHDSFVHTLGSYLREQGVQLRTLRPALARAALQAEPFDLVVLSPGPGRPADAGLSATLALCLARQLPVFGVCLGLQGIVEHFGGSLGVLDAPLHGKASWVQHTGSPLFAGVPPRFAAGRYHSLHAQTVPDCLQVIARTQDGVVMAVEHRRLPVQAVQFHPESLLSLQQDAGRTLLANVVHYARSRRRALSERNTSHMTSHTTHGTSAHDQLTAQP